MPAKENCFAKTWNKTAFGETSSWLGCLINYQRTTNDLSSNTEVIMRSIVELLETDETERQAPFEPLILPSPETKPSIIVLPQQEKTRRKGYARTVAHAFLYAVLALVLVFIALGIVASFVAC
jgi:hypothetical protein